MILPSIIGKRRTEGKSGEKPCGNDMRTFLFPGKGGIMKA